MSHWTMKYLGQPWTPEQNCYYWFRRVMVEQFGRDGLPPDVAVSERGSARLAMRELTDKAAERYGWTRTESPCEGDAVMLAEGKRSSHIGVVVYFKEKLMVIHARKNTGVVMSDAMGLKINNLKITGYWTRENTL